LCTGWFTVQNNKKYAWYSVKIMSHNTFSLLGTLERKEKEWSNVIYNFESQ